VGGLVKGRMPEERGGTPTIGALQVPDMALLFPRTRQKQRKDSEGGELINRTRPICEEGDP